MRIIKVMLMLAFIHCTLIGCSSANTENPWDKKFSFETATIEYSLSGIQTGTAVMYIKDYGANRAYYTNSITSMLFMKVESKTVELTTPDALVTVDLKERTGVSTPNPTKKNREDFEKLTASEKKIVVKNAEILAERGIDIFFLEGAAGKATGDFLGHKVDIINLNGMSIWVLAGTDIPVKSTVSIMGMTTEIAATKISLDGSVDDSKFVMPEGITITSNPFEDAGNIFSVEVLKDPDFEKKIDSYLAEVKKQLNQGQSQAGGGMSFGNVSM